MFSFQREWLMFKNKTCERSRSNVKFVDAPKLVTGPFKTQPNLVSTGAGSFFLVVFLFAVASDQ